MIRVVISTFRQSFPGRASSLLSNLISCRALYVIAHVADDYDFMHPELVDELRARLAPYVSFIDEIAVRRTDICVI